MEWFCYKKGIFLCLLGFCLLIGSSIAKSVVSNDTKSDISLEEILSGRFNPQRFSGTWKNGKNILSKIYSPLFLSNFRDCHRSSCTYINIDDTIEYVAGDIIHFSISQQQEVVMVNKSEVEQQLVQLKIRLKRQM